jgi:DNA-binding NarL/FixJ family response regulator
VSKRILIADDGDAVRGVIRAYFEARTDFQVCGEAADGAEVIEKAKQLKPDLILLDLAMPMMNGVEAASVLRGLMPETPIVLYTMYDDSVGKSIAAAAGVRAVVSKPDGIGKLVECVQSVLRQEPSGYQTAAQ